jgi:Family of unknown function (DUF6529)
MTAETEPPTLPSGAASRDAGPVPVVLLLPLAVGCAVAVALGVYGRLHHPTGVAVNVAGFSGPLAAKAWLTTGVLLLVLVQLGSALVMWGKVPGVRAPSWIGTLHRWSGRAAILLAVPVAVHCLYAAGFQYGQPRVLVHSLLGCFFFGAFFAKMLVLTRSGLPGWVLPVVGGAVFTALCGLWLSAALWFFTTFGVTT